MGASQSVVSPDDFKNYLYGTAVIMMAPRLDQSLQFKDCAKITEEDKNVLPLVLNSTENQNNVDLAEAYAQYYSNGREEAIDNYVTSNILNDKERLDSFMNQFISILKEKHSSKAIRRTNAAVSVPTQSYQSSRRPRPRVSTNDVVGGSASSIRAPVQVQQSREPVQTTASIRTTASRRTNITELQPAPTQEATNVTGLQPAPWGETATAPNNVTSGPEELASVASTTLPQDTMLIRGHGRLVRRMNQVESAIDAEQELLDQNQIQSTEVLIEESHQVPDGSEENTYDERSTIDEELEQLTLNQAPQMS